jgi:rhodanese-related sulfurtransferase
MLGLEMLETNVAALRARPPGLTRLLVFLLVLLPGCTSGPAAHPDPLKPAPDAARPYTSEEVSPQAVHRWIETGQSQSLIDVREPSEFASGHLQGATNLPWASGTLAGSYEGLPRGKSVVLYCQSGGRSHRAAAFLAGKGFKPIFDMRGGFGAWVAAGFQVQE